MFRSILAVNQSDIYIYTSVYVYEALWRRYLRRYTPLWALRCAYRCFTSMCTSVRILVSLQGYLIHLVFRWDVLKRYVNLKQLFYLFVREKGRARDHTLLWYPLWVVHPWGLYLQSIFFGKQTLLRCVMCVLGIYTWHIHIYVFRSYIMAVQ